MRTRIAGIFIAVLFTPIANAELVTYEFTGSVDYILGIPDGLWASVEVGDPFTATYTFDTSVADESPAVNVGAYAQPFDLYLTVGSVNVTVQGFWIVVGDGFNGSYDWYWVHGDEPGTGTDISLQLKDWSQSAFDSDALPLLGGIDMFENRELEIIGGPFHIGGMIDSFVPSPASGVALALGACFMGRRRRRSR